VTSHWAQPGTRVIIRGQGQYAGQVTESYVERLTERYIVPETGRRFSTEYPHNDVPRDPYRGYTVERAVQDPPRVAVCWRATTVPGMYAARPRPRRAAEAYRADDGTVVLTMVERGSDGQRWRIENTHDGVRLTALPHRYRARSWTDRDEALRYIGRRRGQLYIVAEPNSGITPTPVAQQPGNA
jgi:hypothetical protein